MEVCCGVFEYAMPVCVLFVPSRSGIVCNQIAGAITDHSQSAKDIDRYFKFQLYVKDPGHRKPVLVLPNGWVNPERARQKFNFCRRWDSNPQPLHGNDDGCKLAKYFGITMLRSLVMFPVIRFFHWYVGGGFPSSVQVSWSPTWNTVWSGSMTT